MLKPLKNIVIAHQFPLVRAGLRCILTREEGFSIVCEVESVKELHEVLEARKTINAVILDTLIPGGGGLSVLPYINKEHPAIKILLLSHSRDDHIGYRAFMEGASGFISKENSLVEIVCALKDVIAGKRSFSSAIENMIFNQVNRNAPADQLPHQTLSPREFYVFILLGEGKTVTEIATDLSLSVKTISTFRNRVLRKMNMSNNSDIIRYIVGLGLVQQG